MAKPTATAAVVDLHVIHGARPATVGDLFFLDASKDFVEHLLAHLERIVVGVEIFSVGKIQRQPVVYLHRREVAAMVFERQPEYAREKRSRGGLVSRRNNGVVEFDGHRFA